jgi:hypothetical protein
MRNIHFAVFGHFELRGRQKKVGFDNRLLLPFFLRDLDGFVVTHNK